MPRTARLTAAPAVIAFDLAREHLEHCDRCGLEAEVYLEVKRSLARLASPPDEETMDGLRAFADDLTAEELP